MKKNNILLIVIIVIIIAIACVSAYILFFNQEETEIVNSGSLILANEDNYTVRLVDENNQGIANKVIEVSLLTANNQEIRANLTTDANGIIQFEVNNLTAGNYPIIASFAGDSEYMASNLTQIITIINEKTTQTLESQDSTTTKEAEVPEHKHVGDGKGYCRYCGIAMDSLPDYFEYDENDYIYSADGEKMYWVENDGYDGSYNRLGDML